MTVELIIASVFIVLTALIFVRKFDGPDFSQLFKKSPVDIKSQSIGDKKMFYVSKKNNKRGM